MAQLTRQELRQIMDDATPPCIALYASWQADGWRGGENQVMVKNLLRDSERQLKAREVRPDEISKLLRPIQQLFNEQKPGPARKTSLAVLRDRDQFEWLALPYAVDSLVEVGQHFYVKPLMPLVEAEAGYYLLLLSGDHVALYRGDENNMEAVDVPELPKNMHEALGTEQPIESQQFHTEAQPIGPPTAGGGPTQRAAQFFGHGDAADPAKDQKRRFCQAIDRALAPWLRNKGARLPLVLAGTDNVQSMYVEHSEYRDVLVPIEPLGNPEHLPPKELRSRAWQALAPRLAKQRQTAIEKYREALAHGRGSNQVTQILPAARAGRVEYLLAPMSRLQYGDYDLATGVVRVTENAGPDDQELTNLAVMETFRNGGRVHALPAEEMPDGSPLGAVYRY